MQVVRRKTALFVGALGMFLGVISVHATTKIAGLYSTGEGGRKGRPDLHYELIESPRCSFAEAFIASQIPWSWAWAPPGSAWISPYKNARTPAPVGDYVYRLTFDLVNCNGDALDPLSAYISGRFAADDSVKIYLNGNLIASTPGCSWSSGYNHLYTFRADSGFVEGLNELDFKVHNRGCGKSPTGLLVTDICSRGTPVCQPVPEPGTWTLLSVGVAMFGVIRRRANRDRAG